MIRVRDIDGTAKIEVESNNIPVLDQRENLEQITTKLLMIGFDSVLIDPNGYRTGSINIIYEK